MLKSLYSAVGDWVTAVKLGSIGRDAAHAVATCLCERCCVYDQVAGATVKIAPA